MKAVAMWASAMPSFASKLVQRAHRAIGFPYAIRPWSFPRWRAGISSGYGVLTSQGGKRSFRGQFLHAKKHGRGIFTWPDGSADLREKT